MYSFHEHTVTLICKTVKVSYFFTKYPLDNFNDVLYNQMTFPAVNFPKYDREYDVSSGIYFKGHSCNVGIVQREIHLLCEV